MSRYKTLSDMEVDTVSEWVTSACNLPSTVAVIRCSTKFDSPIQHGRNEV